MAPQILLTDNGSLRAGSTLNLRRLADSLSTATGHHVQPVSLLHSNKVPAAELGDRPADTFEPFIRANRDGASGGFVVVPLFFGPTAAAYEYLPQRAQVVRDELDWPDLKITTAPCLVDTAAPEDTRMAEILAEQVRAAVHDSGFDRPAVALCDHGAPRPKVTEVRNFLAGQLADVLGAEVSAVSPCSMERREGSEYDYNEPLLENLLGNAPFDRQVVVSMLFFQPGRHAGPGGDIAEICTDAETRCPGLSTSMTKLVGTHPGLVPILADRLETALAEHRS